jgi:hypothetical protein
MEHAFHKCMLFSYPIFPLHTLRITLHYPSADVDIPDLPIALARAGGRTRHRAAHPTRRQRALARWVPTAPYSSSYLSARRPTARRRKNPKFWEQGESFKSNFWVKTEARGASLREGRREGTIADLDGDAGVGTLHCLRRRGAPRTAADPVGASALVISGFFLESRFGDSEVRKCHALLLAPCGVLDQAMGCSC